MDESLTVSLIGSVDYLTALSLISENIYIRKSSRFAITLHPEDGDKGILWQVSSDRQFMLPDVLEDTHLKEFTDFSIFYPEDCYTTFSEASSIIHQTTKCHQLRILVCSNLQTTAVRTPVCSNINFIVFVMSENYAHIKLLPVNFR
jgi:hypothetical protein